MTDRARQLLQDALTLSDDERLDLADQLLSSLPADAEWLAELERRARRALADPNGGEAWDVVERRLAARVVSRRACSRSCRREAARHHASITAVSPSGVHQAHSRCCITLRLG